jgi:hypothetical protein
MCLKYLRTKYQILIVAALPWLTAIGGCSEQQVAVFPVTGKVAYKGQPPVGATVVLHALNSADTSDIAPTGTVKADGTFAITSYEPGDGAPHGEYVATIEWFKFAPELGGAGPNVIPPKYVSAKTSPIKVSVDGGPTQLQSIIIK